MQNSKSEAYRERLEQWRQAKLKSKEEEKLKQHSVAKKVPLKTKPAMPINNRKPLTVGAAKKPLSDTKRISLTSLKKPTAGVIKRQTETGESMLEKLKKWKEEKGRSEQKRPPPASAHKPSQAPTTAAGSKQGKYRVVKSRLFDYTSKPKPQLNDKENNRLSIAKPAAKNTQLNPGKKPLPSAKSSSSINTKLSKKPTSGLLKPTFKRKSVESNKNPAAKRRHSELPHKKAPPSSSKPVQGILKRKSCFGTIESTVDTKNTKEQTQTKFNSTQEQNKTERSTRRLSYTLDDQSTPLPGTPVISASDHVAVTPGNATRNVRFGTPPGTTPRTEQKKMRKTPKATPKDRKKALEDWLKAKGRTPSKFRHLTCFHEKHGGGHGKSHLEDQKSHDPRTKNSLSVEEINTQMEVIECEQQLAEAEHRLKGMLDECMNLFQDGCPVESILPWLNDIYEKVPCARTSAQYYVCKAAVIKDSLDIDAVLQVFEDATVNNAKPREEIAKCLTETIKYVTENKVKEAARKCRTPRRTDVQQENMFESSKVVYAVSNVTPFSEGKRRRRHTSVASEGGCQVVTPVRRSTRRSLQNLPSSLRDTKVSFSNLDEIGRQDNVLFQPNLALNTILASSDSEDE